MDKVFVERYMNYVNKTPLTKNLEESIFQYINLYNKIQQLHALYFKNLKMVDEGFVQSLDNYKEDIHELKVAHSRLVGVIQSELLNYYTLTHQLTDVLREIYTTVNSLTQIKHQFLEQSILSTQQKIEIMFHLVNNPDYKKLSAQLLISLSRFDKLSEKRNYHCNHVMLLIDAVKTCEEDLVSGYDVNKYDLMVSVSNPKFIKYIEAQLSFHSRLISDLSGLETTLKTKAFPKLWEVISEFKREHRIDPNYALEDVSENSFRDTFNRYLKISKALQTTIGSLEQERNELGQLDSLVTPNYKMMKGKPIALQRGWQWRHPKIVKMVAERDLLSDILREKRLVKLPLKTKDFEFCFQENGVEYGMCKSKLGGGGGEQEGGKKKVKKVKNIATSKAKKLIKGYLDYSQLLTALSANKAKYAQVLTELYQVRDALNKNEYINALDDAVGQLQNQADRVRLTKIMAAQHEADYQEYIRQLTDDNPMLAKLAEKNKYASFIMKKGKNSQEDYFNELDADNMDNFERRSQQIMTSVHKENILKDSVKSMIRKAFESRAGQSVFDIAGTDNRYLEAPRVNNMYLGFGGEFGNTNLNPLTFNPFALISNTDQCLQVMKMGKEEVVAELKTMLKLKYNGDELKRYLAKVDIIANRIIESLKKDRCTHPFEPTLMAELAERYVKLGCTIRCMHTDALHAANLKGGLIGRQIHQCFGMVTKRLIDVECQRLAAVATEAHLLGTKKPAGLEQVIETCVLALMEVDGILERDTATNSYKISRAYLGALSSDLSIDVHDLPNNHYKSRSPEELVYLAKDIETVLRRMTWGVRDVVDRSQKDAVMAAVAKDNIEKCCTRAHKYAKAWIVKKNANELFKLQKLYDEDHSLLQQRKDRVCLLISDAVRNIKEHKKELASIILDIHDPDSRGITNASDYGQTVNALHAWFEQKTSNGSQSKLLAGLYAYNKDMTLDQLIQEDKHRDLESLVNNLSRLIQSANASTPLHWVPEADATKAQELKKNAVAGYASGEPVPVIITNLLEMLDSIDLARYEIQCEREKQRIQEYEEQAKVLDHSEDIEKYIGAYTRTQEASASEHEKCTKATGSIANVTVGIARWLIEILKIFRHFNRAVVCMMNAMMPNHLQTTCAKATVGNNIHIASLVDLGRRLHAINDSRIETRRILDCSALANEIDKLAGDWMKNAGEIQTALEAYTASAKKMIKKEKEIARDKDLLEYVEQGIKLKEIGDLLALQKEKEDATDILRMRVHKLERESNESHRNISKSFSRYRRMISVETDHLALLKEMMKFIELWNKCYSSTDTKTDPLDLLFSRIATDSGTNKVDSILRLLQGEINKYANNTTGCEIDTELREFLAPGALVSLLQSRSLTKMGGGRRRRTKVVKRKRAAKRRSTTRRTVKRRSRRQTVHRKRTVKRTVKRRARK